jgi:uncharacterized membrane protein YdjX (TVP38/TMEM64 family)
VLLARSGALGALASGDREDLHGWLAGLGPLAPAASIGLNVVQAVIAPLPGFVIPYVDGAAFGTWAGALITWVGGLCGAMACFALARTAVRPLASRWCSRSRRLEVAAARLERSGGVATLLARLLPGSPFDLVSYLAGLSGMRPWPFLWGTAAGSAPKALAYAWMGSSLGIPLWLGLALTPLAGLAWLAAAALMRPRPRPAPQ